MQIIRPYCVGERYRLGDTVCTVPAWYSGSALAMHSANSKCMTPPISRPIGLYKQSISLNLTGTLYFYSFVECWPIGIILALHATPPVAGLLLTSGDELSHVDTRGGGGRKGPGRLRDSDDDDDDDDDDMSHVTIINHWQALTGA